MKSYGKISLLLTAFIFSAFQSFGQTEICANGIDDDGDGFVDCYDGDCADGVDCADFYVGNSVFCKDEPTENPTFSIRLQWASADRTANSHATPMIGDIDQDGTPEVVVSNKQARTLTILDGVTGVLDANVANNPINLSFEPENVPVIADFDGDGCAEILVNEDRGNGDIALIDCQGNILWQEVAGDHIGLPGVADFNEDGNPEIYYRDEIRDVNGNVVVPSNGGDWERDWAHGPIAVDILPDAFCTDCSGLELITGNEIWAVNIAAGTKTLAKDLNTLFATNGETRRYHPKYFQSWDDQWTAISVADFDQDGDMDVLMPGAFGGDYRAPTTIFFWDPNQDQILTYADPTNDHPRGTGRINIADVNGDGRLNATYVSDQILYALQDDMTPLWRKGIKEGSSGFTGCTLFDFDGDGASETVYRSESELLIIDGTDGSTRRAIACVSRTQEEYPIVADVDNDGSSEICVTCYTNNTTPFNPYSNTEFSHVRVYEADGGEIWQPSRRVWNQHGYFNVNINDDLTVPVQMQDHTRIFGTDCDGGLSDNRPLNSFLNQSTFLEEDGCPSYVSPDLNLLSVVSASSSQCPLTTFDVSFDVRNDGDTDISGSLPITFYAGDPRTAGATRLNTEVIVINNFQIGETRTLTATVEGPGGDVDLYMIINDNGSDNPPVTLTTSSIPECSTENNIGRITATYEPFPLSVEKIADNRKCDDALPDNGRARAFYFGQFGGGIETVWAEDFQDLARGTETDNGETAWSYTGGKNGARTIAVDDFNGGRAFVGNNTGGSNESDLVTWTSESIDITGLQDVSIAVDLISATSGHEGASSQWRDLIRAYYILDGGSRVLMNNGEHYGNYIFQQATVGNLTGSTVQIQIELHNTANAEYNVFDNVLVQGFRPPVEREYTEADGFTFEWFDGTDFSAPIHTGSNYADMAEGTYSVVGFSTDANCASDTLTVEIARVTPQYRILITEVSPLTDCAVPNGELFAQAVTLDENGDDVDTLTTGYEFTWLASDLVTTLATGPTLANQTNGTYTVNVLNTTTGCPVSASADISTQLITPDLPTASAVDVTDCNNLASGELSANVNGNTTDYTFLWYEGTTIQPTEDYTGANVTGVEPGDYTVVAVDNATNCESQPVTATVNPPTDFPDPVATAIQPNTGCDTPNGQASADADGQGTTAGHTFEWFAGNNTLASNLLPNASYPDATVSGNTASGLSPGIYTVRVTNNTSNCVNTDTVEIVDNSAVPEWNFVQEVDAGNAIQFDDKAYIEIPQAVGGLDGITISYWAFLSDQNYLNDHMIFSSGGKSESQIALWADNSVGISFVVKTENDGGNGRIDSEFKPTGWTQVTGTWSAATSEMRLYVNGVLIASQTYTGVAPFTLIDSGNDMYIGRDGNLGANKFQGLVDEFRIYNRQLTDEEIRTLICSPNTATDTGLILNYDFNTDNGTAKGDPIDNSGSLGAAFDGSINWPGNAAAAIQYPVSGIECPLSDRTTPNYTCDPANPTGAIDLTGGIDPAGDYTYSLYRGFEIVDPDSLEATNTTGIFTGLSEGLYVVQAQDNTSDCETRPLLLSIELLEDDPVLTTSTTPSTFCVNGDGTITVTSSNTLAGAPAAGYEYVLYDGANSDPANELARQAVADGSIGFTFQNLVPGQYRIQVINNDILCETFEDVVVGDNTTDPVIDGTQDFDVLSCDPANPDGVVRVTSVDGNTDLSNYTFTWYTGTVVDAANIITDSTRFELVGVAAGSYTAVATSTVTGCESPGATMTIVDAQVNPTLASEEIQPNTACDASAADGIARVYVTGITGVDPTSYDLDTDFTYQWYTDAGLSSPISGATASRQENLATGTYYVEITYTATGCSSVGTVSVSNVPTDPILSTNSTVPNTACDPAAYDGEILVDVAFNGVSPVANPSANGYTFEWFYSDGTQVTDGGTILGSTTDNPTGLGADTYEVTVTGPNGCTSDPLLVTLTDNPTLPVPVAVEEEPNTSCAVGNGIAAVTSVNGGSPNLAEFTYEWFLGSNTNAANALPGPTNLNAFLADDDPFRLGGLDPGIYTVRITSDAGNGGNGCSEIVTVEITDAAEDPLIVDENDILITPQTTCDPSNYGGSIDISNAVDGTTDAQVGNQNGSFEDPGIFNNPNTGDFNPLSGRNNFFGFPNDVNNPGAGYYSEDLIPGWVTDDPWGVLEIWRSGNTSNGYTAYEGDHWAELNSQFASALYFDVNTVPGTTMIWRFAHRGRNDQDCMDLNIGPSNDPGNLTTIGNFCSETVNTGPNTENGWAIYEGTYVVPDGQYSTRFEYRSTDPSNPQEGNFIDGVEFFIDPFTFEGELADGSGTTITDPENDGLFENLPAGEYQFTVRDNFTGCESDIIYVTVPDETQRPDFAFDAVNSVVNSVCDVAVSGGFNGEVALSNQGAGTFSDYTFTWYEGPNTSNLLPGSTGYDVSDPGFLRDIPGGTYTVEIQNSTTLCDTTFQVTIVDEFVNTVINETPVVNVTNDNSCNADNGELQVDASGFTQGSGDYTYYLHIGAVADATPDQNNTTGAFNGLTPGEYTVEVVDNITGCISVPVTEEIDEVPLRPDFEIAALGAGTENNTVCDETLAIGSYTGQITVNPLAGAVTDYTYTWYDGATTDPGSISTGTANDNVLSDIQGGTYTVRIVSNDNACDTTFQVDIVDEINTNYTNYDLTADLSAIDDNSCNSDNGSITFDPSTLSAAPANGSGNYTVRLYNGNSVVPPPAAEDNTAPYEFTGLAPGDYTVEVLDNVTGCVTLPATITIDEVPVDIQVNTVAVTDVSNCVGVAPNGVIEVTPTMADGNEPTSYSYQWYFGSGDGNTLDATDLTDGSALAGTTSNLVSGLQAGTYTVEITNDDTDCSQLFEYEVEENTVLPTWANASILTTPNEICDGTPNGTIDPRPAITPAAGAGVTYTYELLDAAGTTVLQTEDTGSGDDGLFENLADGNYRLRATINESGCISATTPVTVGEDFTFPALNATAFDETSCDSPNGRIEVANPGETPTGGFTVNIYNGVGTATLNQNLGTAVAAWPVVSTLTLDDGTYTVELINNETGCITLEQVNVQENLDEPALDPADVTLANDTYCTSDNGEITVTVDDTNIANNDGANPVFNLYNGNTADPTNLRETQQPGANTYTFTGLPAGTYTVTIEKDESGCISNPITRTIQFVPETFVTSSTLLSNQTSCDLNTPNGSLSVAVTSGPSTDPADYTFEYFRGQNTNPGNEVVAAIDPDPTFNADRTEVNGLPAGTYTVRITNSVSGCFELEEVTIIRDSDDPTFTLDGTTDNTSCDSPNGIINFTINSGSPTVPAPFDGAAGYTVELFDGPTIGPSEAPLGTTTANDGAAAQFTGLAEGTFSIRARDNNTSCIVEELNIAVGYSGPSIAVDPTLMNNNPLSTGCFTNDGTLNIGTAISNITATYTDDIVITWFVGSDTSDVSTTIANMLGNPSSDFTDVVVNNLNGDPVTVVNGQVDNLPAVSYTGVIELSNGCKYVLQTSLSIVDQPDVVAAVSGPLTRCDNPFDGSITITIDPEDGISADQYEYFVFDGNISVMPNTDGSAPFDPALDDLSVYPTPIAQADFTNTSTAVGAGNVDNAVINNLDSGVYTVAIRINDGDGCVTNVLNVTIDPPAESEITLDNTVDNTICDSGLGFNGSAQVSASNPAGGTFDFTWYEDLDGDGNYDLLQSGNGSGTGLNVANETETDVNTTTVTGLGAGSYRVIAIHNAGGSVPPGTACPDTLDIEIFDDPVNYTLTAADVNLTNITDCGQLGTFTINQFRENGAIVPVTNYSTTWIRLSDNQDITPFFGVSRTDLRADDYRIEIVNDLTGCEFDYEFTIEDQTENPILLITGVTENTTCIGGPNGLDPTGSITINVEYEGSIVDPTTGFTIELATDPAFGAGDLITLNGSNTSVSGNDYTIQNLAGDEYFIRVTDTSTPDETCNTISSAIVITDNPAEVSIQTTPSDIAVEHQENCDPEDGRIEVLRVLEDGAAVNAIGDYDFEWFVDDVASTALDATSVPTVNFPSGANGPEVENLPAGFYYVRATNTITDCTTSGLVEIQILDETVEPGIEVVQVAPDTECFSNTGTGIIEATTFRPASPTSNDFVYEWFEGSSADANFLLDNTTPGGSVTVSGYTITGAFDNRVENLPSGTYFVRVTDPSDPGDGCFAEETVIINQFTPVITLQAEGIGYDVVDDNACDIDNGSITVNQIRETRPGNTFVENTTLTDYDLEWFDAPTGGASLGTGPSLTNLGAGTYYLDVDNNTTDCDATTRFAVVVEDVSINPTTVVVSRQPDTYCDNSGNAGDGVLDINLRHPALINPVASGDYDIEWYRGTVTDAATIADPEFLFDNQTNLGTPANRGTAALTTDGTSLTGLSTGDYTVIIRKIGGAPNNGCLVLTTYSIDNDQPSLTVPTSGIDADDNENCVNPNGSIVISEVAVDGSVVTLDNSGTYVIDWVQTNGETPTTTGVGTPNSNTLADIDEGTYTFRIRNTVTGCVTPNVDVEIFDVPVNPTTVIVSRQPDTYCDNTGNAGDGELDINLRHPALIDPVVDTDYEIEWYRGTVTATATTADPEFLFDNQTNLGTAANRGTAALTTDGTSLTGLSTGAYTVLIRKIGGAPNDGCLVVRTFTIGSNPPTITIQDADYTITNNDNCAGAYNGEIEITQIREDAAIFTDMNNYDFVWETAAGVAVASGQGINTISNLAPGEYVLNVTNRTTGCPPSDQDYTFVVGDDAVEPVVQFDARTPDTYCVPGGGFDGDGTLSVALLEDATDITAPNAADWTIEWYRGNTAGNTTDATFLYDNQASASGAQVGTATLGANILSLEGLSAGFYTVSVTKTNDPNNQCAVVRSFEVLSNPETVTIDPAQDITFDDNFNCDNPNGFIEVTNVREDGDPNAYPLSDYTFTWTIDGNAFVDGTDGDIVNAGAGTGNRIENLAGNTYTVTAVNNVTGCTISDEIDVVIDDLPVNPEIVFVDKTSSEGCDFDLSNFEGSGTLTISVLEEGAAVNNADYSFTWYRGQSATPGQELFGPNQGTAAEVTAGDATALEGLSVGFYTLAIEKTGGSPNDGCEAVRTFEILEERNFPTINIPDTQITHNTICNDPGNGAITINSADVTITGGGDSNVDDFTWTVNYDDGTGAVPFAFTVAGADGTSTIALTNLNAGTYTFVAESTLGCASGNYVVEIRDDSRAPEIDQVEMIPNTDCTGGNLALGSIEILLIDGAAPTADYSYQWYVGLAATAGQEVSTIIPSVVDDNSVLLANVPDGFYTVEVTNNGTPNTGCVSRQTIEVTSDPIIPYIIQFETNDDLLCDSDNGGFTLNSIEYDGTRYNSGITADSAFIASTFELIIRRADGTTPVDGSPANLFVFDSLAPGNYTAQIRHTAANCVSPQVSFTIEDNRIFPRLSLVELAPDMTCDPAGTPMGQLWANIDNGQPDSLYTITWFDGAGNNLNVSNDTISNLSAGRYRVVVSNNATGCEVEGAITLTSDPLNPDIRSVVGTDPTTCDPVNGQVEVTQMSTGDLSDYEFEFWLGDPTNGGVSLTAGFQPDSIYRNADVGTYFVQARHIETQCLTNYYQIDLSDDNLTYPTISLAFDALGEPVSKNNTSCDPTMPTGRLSVTANGSQDEALYSFVWFDNNNTQIGTGATLDSLRAGTYIVEVTNLTTGCSTTEDYRIADDVPPVVLSTSASPNTNCVDPNGIVAATVINVGDNPEYRGAQNYSYYWFLTDVANPEASIANGDFVYTGSQVNDLGSGIYYVVAQDNIVNCFTSDPVPVEVIDETMTPMLEVTVQSNLTICDPERPNGLVTIDDPNNNLGRYTIEWYVGTDTTGVMPFTTGVFVDSLTIGQYSAVVTDRITGCVQIAPFDIMDETPVFDPVETTILSQRTNCQIPNGFARANVGGETLGFLFEWFNETDLSTPVYVGPEQRAIDTGRYVVRATHVESGCVVDADTIEIRFQEIVPAFELDIENSICLRTEDGSTNQFSGQAFIQFEQFNELDTIVWFEGSGRTQDDEAFAISFNEKLIDVGPGEYSVWFRPNNGCDYYASFSIQAAIKIYNGVSANADGLNDFFLLDCIDTFENNNVQIFNRDGTKVWEADGYNNQDVRFAGVSNVGNKQRELPVGTYFFIIDKGDGSQLINGYLELVR